MISDAVLEQGVVRGIVTDQQASALRMLAREISAPAASEPQDDEKLRFITGFSDIFVTIGIGLFASAVHYLVESFAGLGVSAIALATISWLLAELFTRRRRMALPSIVLLCVFSGAVFLAGAFYLGDWLSGPDLDPSNGKQMIVITISATITAILTGIHYYRFRVPITVAVGAAAIAACLVAALFSIAPRFSEQNVHIIVMIVGIAFFVLAMRFDLSDPERVTRRTDIAFWLHMLAAPLIVHPVIAPLITQESSLGEATLTLGTAGAILAIFAVLSLVALIIDRRAMLVSSLIYVGYASAALIQQVGLGDQTVMPATLLTLGAFILLLSAGWRPARAMLLKLIPSHLARRLPHPIL
jgi:hypothetical protein